MSVCEQRVSHYQIFIRLPLGGIYTDKETIHAPRINCIFLLSRGELYIPPLERRTAVFRATTYADNRRVIIIIAMNTKKYIQEPVQVCDGDCLGVLPHRKPLVLKISPIASIGNIFKSNTSGAKIDA